MNNLKNLEEFIKVCKEYNKLQDVLLDMVTRLNDPLLHRSDFNGHLGLGTPHLTMLRIMLGARLQFAALQYIYKQISAEQYAKIKSEVKHEDMKFWDGGIYSAYRKPIRLLPLK